MINNHRKVILYLAFVMILSACTSSSTGDNEARVTNPVPTLPPPATKTVASEPSESPELLPTETLTQPPTETPVPPPTETQTPEPTETAAAPIPLPLPDTGETVNPDWQVEAVDIGIKPALAIDSQNRAHVTYMVESEHGFVKYGLRSDDSWELATVALGYFYGPPAIDVSSNDNPHIVWHDHQDTMTFVPEKGDAVRAVSPGDGEWFLGPIKDEGHDGWDNSIVLDGQDVAHTVWIDPSQFDSVDGVQYAFRTSIWNVETIGSGPIKYEFGTAIDVDVEELPGITYYDDVAGTLKYAHRNPDREWTIESVDQNGNTGKFSSLAYDTDGQPHISYFVDQSETAGTVRYAFWDGVAWKVEDVDGLVDVEQGSLGARHLTWIRMDSQGNPHIAYNDKSQLMYASRNENGWKIEVIAEAGEKPFSQLVVLDLDDQDQPHLVYAVFVDAAIPQGVVKYAARR